jgi:hypothetical protein
MLCKISTSELSYSLPSCFSSGGKTREGGGNQIDQCKGQNFMPNEVAFVHVNALTDSENQEILVFSYQSCQSGWNLYLYTALTPSG